MKPAANLGKPEHVAHGHSSRYIDKNVVLWPILRVHNNFVSSPPSPYRESDLILLAWWLFTNSWSAGVVQYDMPSIHTEHCLPSIPEQQVKLRSYELFSTTLLEYIPQIMSSTQPIVSVRCSFCGSVIINAIFTTLYMEYRFGIYLSPQDVSVYEPIWTSYYGPPSFHSFTLNYG